MASNELKRKSKKWSNPKGGNLPDYRDSATSFYCSV
jgi:hypothetical protein